MKRQVLKILPLVLFVALGLLVFNQKRSNAAAYIDFQTTPTSDEDGDTILTHPVACSSQTATLMNSTWTVITLVTGSTQPYNYNFRQLRKRTFNNISAQAVYIGSAAATNTLFNVGYLLAVSSTTSSIYQSHNSANFYCTTSPSATVGSVTIDVIEEINSIP